MTTENWLPIIGEKALEVIQAGWPGLVCAVSFWMLVKLKNYVFSTPVQTDEQRLFDLVKLRLEHPHFWRREGRTLASNVNPPINLSWCDDELYVKLNGQDISGLLSYRSLSKLMDLAEKIESAKKAEERQRKLNEALGAFAPSYGAQGAVVKVVPCSDKEQELKTFYNKVQEGELEVVEEIPIVPTKVDPKDVVHPHNLAYPRKSK